MESCLPSAFIEKIQIFFGDKASSILESFGKKRSINVRVNILRASIKEIEDFFKKNNIIYIVISAVPLAFVLPNITTRDVTDLEIYKEGKIYIQSLSSMLPVLVLDPQPGDHILDMAAAPGSKTSQIAAYTANGAEIVANDIDRGRLYKLKAIMAQQGCEHITVTSIPGQTIWQQYPEYFDKVLLDAPCSMEGRFDCQDKKSYKHWSTKKVKNLARLQQWLLRSALSSTKVGGTIVYSTCTISPEENEGAVNWLLEKEKNAVIVEDIALSDLPMHNGFTTCGNTHYLPQLIKTKRIIPTEYYEGFYVAKLKKIQSTVKRLS